GAEARDDRRGPRPGARGRGRQPRPWKARRPDYPVPLRKPLRSGRGSNGRGRLRRFPRRGARDDRGRRDPLPARRQCVARGTQHRKRRTPTHARVAPATPKGKPKRVKHERWGDQLFFSRLRVHAKWVFVFLALVFALGFVFFGVGSGSTGISDVLQNFFTGSSSSGASASSLRKKAEQHPNQAQPWHALAT